MAESMTSIIFKFTFKEIESKVGKNFIVFSFSPSDVNESSYSYMGTLGQQIENLNINKRRQETASKKV